MSKMKKYIAFVLLCCFVVANPASAQELQNTSSGLQQQTGSTQNTRTLQNEQQTLQNQKPVNVFDRGQTRSLGVVSSPSQTKPDVTVTADENLKATLDEPESGGNLLVTSILVLAGFVVVFGLLRYVLRQRTPAYETTVTEATTENVIAEKPKKKKSKKTAGKKKKPHHR